MYALNIDHGTGRILSATFPKYAAPGMPLVETLPEGDISNYRYLNGECVLDPLPTQYPRTAKDVEAGMIFAVSDNYYRAIMPIPRGEAVTRYNAEPVSVVDIVNALQEAQKGE